MHVLEIHVNLEISDHSSHHWYHSPCNQQPLSAKHFRTTDKKVSKVRAPTQLQKERFRDVVIRIPKEKGLQTQTLAKNPLITIKTYFKYTLTLLSYQHRPYPFTRQWTLVISALVIIKSSNYIAMRKTQ
jgi:hypothetical protein